MSTLTKQCIDMLKTNGHSEEVALGMIWILAREYKRVHGTQDDIAAWDSAVQNGWDNKTWLKLDPGAKENDFIILVNKIMASANSFPGWNADQCIDDWGEFAAFANWAAKQDTAALNALNATLQPNKPIPYTADPAIKADMAYNPSWPISASAGTVYAAPPPSGIDGVVYGGPGLSSSNTALIVAGIGAAVLIGGGLIYALTRKQRGVAANPRGDEVYREYLENAAWKHAPSSSRGTHGGQRSIMHVNPSTGHSRMTPVCELSVEELETSAGIRSHHSGGVENPGGRYTYAVVESRGMHGSGEKVRAVYRTNDLARAKKKAEKFTREYRESMERHGGSSGGYRVVESENSEWLGNDIDSIPSVS